LPERNKEKTCIRSKGLKILIVYFMYASRNVNNDDKHNSPPKKNVSVHGTLNLEIGNLAFMSCNRSQLSVHSSRLCPLFNGCPLCFLMKHTRLIYSWLAWHTNQGKQVDGFT